ncbi:unnamed protein product [Ilex paraguariensis]|uniref:Uncharacterized protein n=1 Tax=Ilex paraguariensis TaxID=185542 RepID=A0ABC8QXU8_9AQUA
MTTSTIHHGSHHGASKDIVETHAPLISFCSQLLQKTSDSSACHPAPSLELLKPHQDLVYASLSEIESVFVFLPVTTAWMGQKAANLARKACHDKTSSESLEWNDEPTEEQGGTESLPVVIDDTCANQEKKEENSVVGIEENEWDKLLRVRSGITKFNCCTKPCRSWQLMHT